MRLSVELHDVVDNACRALGTDPDIYQRDGQLVDVIRAAEGDRERLMLAGTPQIRTVTAPTLRERLTRAACWERFDARVQGWVPAGPTDAVVKAALLRGFWPAVRPLVGIIEAPSMRPDGTLIDAPGYDDATAYLYTPSADFPGVPLAPTREDARWALDELLEPFADFPMGSDAPRSVAVAAVLTLLARPGIRGSVPAFVIDASTRGSGKTLLADVIAMIATGRPTSKMTYPSDDAELEKVLGAYAIRGASMIAFDNVTGRFGGGPLDRCITCGDSVELRVLGRSEIPTLRWRAVLLATGNNVVMGGDTARRCLVARLESDLEHPEDRQDFSHANLLAWVAAERPRLVRAALVVLRAFIQAGRPMGPCKTWGSFEAWSALIPPAIAFAGGGDPMACRPTVTGEEEPEAAALAVLLRDWPRLDPTGQGVTARTVVGLLYTTERLRGQTAPPDGFEDMREAIELVVPTKPGMAPDPTRLGQALRKYRGRVLGGCRFAARTGGGGVQRWTVTPPRAT